MLVVLLLSVLRVLCLSLMVALIYSGAVLITFIFVVMTFDQSDILCIPSYKFIPVLVLWLGTTRKSIQLDFLGIITSFLTNFKPSSIGCNY